MLPRGLCLVIFTSIEILHATAYPKPACSNSITKLHPPTEPKLFGINIAQILAYHSYPPEHFIVPAACQTDMSNVDEARRHSTDLVELHQHDLDGERTAKRQRVAAACDECRSKKGRCDGQRPGRERPCSANNNPSVVVQNDMLQTFYC